MATTNYPKIGIKPWAALRTRASSAPSTKFTPDLTGTILQQDPTSARNNVLAPLKRFGLINEDGSLTDRGHKWRVDSSYPDACQEILDDVYPGEFSALTDGKGNPDLTSIKTWLGHKGFGDSNARQIAATYAFIASKTVPDLVVCQLHGTR